MNRELDQPQRRHPDPECDLRDLRPLALIASGLRQAGRGLSLISEEMDLPRQTVILLLALDVA